METVEGLLLTGRADELKGVRAADPEVQELLDTVPYIMVSHGDGVLRRVFSLGSLGR